MSSFSVNNAEQLQTLTSDTPVQVWPECETCHVPYAFRRCLTLTPAGHQWLWTRDCKHKSGRPIMMTSAGPLENTAAGDA